MKTLNPFLALSVHLGAIQENYLKICQFTGVEVAAVVKANAYGVGAKEVSKALEEAGCTRFYVATFCEAAALRQHLHKKSDIFLFNGFSDTEFHALSDLNIRPVFTSLDQLKRYGSKVSKIILHFDTGLSRLSIPDHDVSACLKLIDTKKVSLVISHLACADQRDHPMNQQQLNRFQAVSEHFPAAQKSLAASKGINLGRQYFFDEVRVGIYLYGFSPSVETNFSKTLTPAITATSQILGIQSLEKGQSVGYGATFIAPQPMKIATIAGGYADGTPLAFSNLGCVSMEGKLLPIIGRVSMDLTTIDISSLSDAQAKVGNWVDLIPSPMSFYKKSIEGGSSPHEMLTRLGDRFSRKYDK